MIKARGTDERGRPLMIYGLSHENLARLVADEPIVLDAAELGFDGTVLIMAGKTEDDVAAALGNGRSETPENAAQNGSTPTGGPR